jgi:hypothetical protein
MRKKRMRMSDGSEFTVFFLGEANEKPSAPTYILNPQLDKYLIKEIIEDNKMAIEKQWKLNTNKLNPNKMDWDL